MSKPRVLITFNENCAPIDFSFDCEEQYAARLCSMVRLMVMALIDPQSRKTEEPMAEQPEEPKVKHTNH